MAGITPGAERFITGAISPEEARAADLTVAVAESTAPAADLMIAAAESTAHAAQLPGPSTETGRRREATPHPAVRAASARAPTAATTMADRPRHIRHAAAPAWVAEPAVAVAERVAAEDLAAAVAGVIS